MPIPVICDRCRATGHGGDADFAHLGDLLQFKPVPRLVARADGWTAEKQRAFIAALSVTGSKRQAAQAVGMAAYGVDQLLRHDDSDSFKAAFERALAIARQNGSMKIAAGIADVAARNAQLTPASRLRGAQPPLPGQMLNEHGEYEDQASLDGRVAEVRVKWTQKFLYARRLYLSEISPFPFKRVAFEILTQYPIDWDKAERLEPQEDEPWRVPVMREPAMLLTAENGWMGDFLHGEDKKAELRAMLNAHLIEQGEDPIEDESADGESAETKTTDGEADASA